MAEIFRIAINGPESTGKSQLASDLAQHFGCGYVPEIAREYLHQLGRPYEEKDLLEIARLQIDAEEKPLQQQPPLLICDTSLLVIKIWSHFKYGRCHPWIETTEQTRKYSLHLLTDIDLPGKMIRYGNTPDNVSNYSAFTTAHCYKNRNRFS